MASEVVKTVPAVELSRLDERAREIFRRVVEDYLATGEPVGSRNVSRSLPIALSAASVRNVMSDLEALGLIYAPHTSAGRLPTDLGLRLFVDGILQFGEVSAEDSERIEALARSSGASKNVEGVLSEASALLSGLTRGARLVVSSKVSPRFRHIEFVRLEADRALVVLVSEDGSVENRVVAMPPGLPASALVEASNWLNAHIRGRSLEEARKDLEGLQAMRQREVDELTQKVVEAGLASVSAAGEGQTPLLIVHGHANLLENLKAMEELERVRLLFEDLERKKDIVHLLNATEQADGVRIFIGSENKLFSLSGSSVVTAPFRDSKHNIVGVIGVIGPTRLNYARIVPMVDYTARLVSKLLT